jgi:hypothetical protein
MSKAIIVQSSDGWAAWLSAVGTLALAFAVVGVALWSDKRTGARLGTEQAHSKEQLASEQAFSREQLEEELQVARDREQLAEAHAVQVVRGEKPQILRDPRIEELAAGELENIYGLRVDLMHLAAVLVNRGSYTITRVEAQFSPGGRGLIPHK